MKLVHGLVRPLGLCVLTVALVVAGGCSRDRAGERSSNAEIEFRATDQVPNVDDPAFGWRAWAVDAQEPVKWIESMTLPEAPGSGAGGG